jgi:EVE domain-containing protein
MTNWLLVSSPENFEKSRALGFRQAAMKSRHRRKWERVAPGDRVFFYLTGVKSIGGVARVTGTPFESHEKIWGSKAKPLEDYPWRFPTEPVAILDPGALIPAEPLARQMDYAKRWPAANWTLAFQGNVHELNDRDAELLMDAVRAAAPAAA